MCSEAVAADQSANVPSASMSTLSKAWIERPAWDGVADVAPVTGRDSMATQPFEALQALHADCEDVL